MEQWIYIMLDINKKIVELSQMFSPENAKRILDGYHIFIEYRSSAIYPLWHYGFYATIGSKG